MKVGINTTALLSPKSGIGQYVKQLTQRLISEPSLRLEFFCGLKWGAQPFPSEDTQKTFGRYSALDKKANALPGINWFARNFKSLLRQSAFLRGERRLGLDLFHEPNFISIKSEIPTVITVHDMSPFRLGQHHKKTLVRLFHEKLPGSIERAAAIIVDSQFVKTELLDYFPAAAHKVYPVHLAAGPEFTPQARELCDGFLKEYSLQYKKYLLAVGTLESRKNLLSALRAFAKLPENIKQTIPFVIAGMKGWLNGPFEKEAAPLISKGQVRLLGYVADNDLPKLYTCAAAMIYPSIYEGFGLPPLEAMACGTPVITSNVSSIPEVVGDAGYTVNPYDIDALSGAIREVLEDEQLSNRMIKLGLTQAFQFTWEKTAEETVHVYRNVLGNR